MIRFEVSKNGDRICTAGIDADCVLHSMVTFVDVVDPGPTRRTTLGLDVGGLNCDTRQHLRWSHVPLIVGDCVEVRILDAGPVDPPREAVQEKSVRADLDEDLGRIRARRKALLRELKDLDRDERAYLKRKARLKPAARSGAVERKAKKRVGDTD